MNKLKSYSTCVTTIKSSLSYWKVLLSAFNCDSNGHIVGFDLSFRGRTIGKWAAQVPQGFAFLGFDCYVNTPLVINRNMMQIRRLNWMSTWWKPWCACWCHTHTAWQMKFANRCVESTDSPVKSCFISQWKGFVQMRYRRWLCLSSREENYANPWLEEALLISGGRGLWLNSMVACVAGVRRGRRKGIWAREGARGRAQGGKGKRNSSFPSLLARPYPRFTFERLPRRLTQRWVMC